MENEAFFGLPANVEFCKNCVISNERLSSTVELGGDKNDKKATIVFADGLCFITERSFTPRGTIAYVMLRERSVDIDTAFDFKVTEALMFLTQD
jgi:hypothetical protein